MFRYFPQISIVAATFAGYTTVHRHTFGAQSECKKQSLYKDEDKSFDENTQKIIDELTDYFLLRISTSSLARLKFFWSNRQDTDHFGTHYSRSGTYVGVPVTFGYQSKADVDLSCLANCGISITENNPEALESLKDSLVLSENAKRFALAMELHALNSLYVLLKCDFILCILAAYNHGCMLSPYTTRKSDLVQLFFLFGLVTVWLGVYHQLEGFLSKAMTAKADRKAAEMGNDFLEGGIEYLSKLQQRNIALRTLQLKGSNTYKENGDVISKFYHIPIKSLSTRKKLLLNIKKNKDSKERQENVESDTLEIKMEIPGTTIEHKMNEKESVSPVKEDPLSSDSAVSQNAGWLSWITKLFR